MKFVVDKASLVSVADAIREKGNTTDELEFPQGFVNAVNGIESGGGKGVVWTEVDTDGYPIKVDASSVKNTQNLFRYGDYVRTKEIILPTNRPLNFYFICYQNYALEKINLPTNAENITNNGGFPKIIGNSCFLGCKALILNDWQIPEGVTIIEGSAFESAESLTDRIIPLSVIEIAQKAFNRCYSMQKVVFLGTPTTIATSVFSNCTSLADIYVPWAEGAVANAPWGATNATIYYNTTYDENHEPIIAEV